MSWLCTWWKQAAGAGCWVALAARLLQIATAVGSLSFRMIMSWLCALSRHGAGAGCWHRALVLGCGAGAGCCKLAVRVVETGCRCWVLAVRVVETACAGAGAGAVSWQRAWWRLGAGAGRWLCAWWRQGAGCRVLGAECCWVLVLGAVSWRAGARCWCPLLTVK